MREDDTSSVVWQSSIVLWFLTDVFYPQMCDAFITVSDNLIKPVTGSMGMRKRESYCAKHSLWNENLRWRFGQNKLYQKRAYFTLESLKNDLWPPLTHIENFVNVNEWDVQCTLMEEPTHPLKTEYLKKCSDSNLLIIYCSTCSTSGGVKTSWFRCRHQ